MLKIIYEDAKTLYTENIPVVLAYINYGNHVGNDAYLSILQEARVGWLKKNNMGEMNISENTGFLVTAAAIVYKSQAFHGDLLQVNLYVHEYTKKTFCMRYKIVNLTTAKTAAIAETEHVFYDYIIKKVVIAPESFLSAIHTTPL